VGIKGNFLNGTAFFGLSAFYGNYTNLQKSPFAPSGPDRRKFVVAASPACGSQRPEAIYNGGM
jgi:hypothetical protein